MALKDKIITYNLTITYEDHSHPVYIIPGKRKYKNISKSAVEYFSDWYHDNYEEVDTVITANVVK